MHHLHVLAGLITFIYNFGYSETNIACALVQKDERGYIIECDSGHLKKNISAYEESVIRVKRVRGFVNICTRELVLPFLLPSRNFS